MGKREKKRAVNERLRRWEAALMAAVAVVLLCGARLDTEQAALAEKVIRLHVLANSDSEEDQALKLKVRDAVLAEAEGRIPPDAGRAEAEAILKDALPELAQAAAGVVEAEGYPYAVTVSVEENVWFPTKTYTDFAMPCGTYTALRVVIGQGDGQNWWCVVFPPLCLGSVSETVPAALEGGLNAKEVALITGESEGYVVKFKAIELLEDVQRWLS